jgi:hypothetical protein
MPARRTIRKWLTAGVVAVSAMASTAILATPAIAGGRWEPSGSVSSGSLLFDNSTNVYCEEIHWDVTVSISGTSMSFSPMMRMSGRQVRVVDYGYARYNSTGSMDVRVVRGGAHYSMGSSGC